MSRTCPTIKVEVEDAAADTDVLSGTDLDPIPVSGTLCYWVASTVNTATLEFPSAFKKPAVTHAIALRGNGIPEPNSDQPFVTVVTKGQNATIVLGGTTGTCHSVACLYAGKTPDQIKI